MGQRGGGVGGGPRARVSALHLLEPEVSQRPFETVLLLHPPDKREIGRRGSGGPKRRESCGLARRFLGVSENRVRGQKFYCGSWG